MSGLVESKEFDPLKYMTDENYRDDFEKGYYPSFRNEEKKFLLWITKDKLNPSKFPYKKSEYSRKSDSIETYLSSVCDDLRKVDYFLRYIESIFSSKGKQNMDNWASDIYNILKKNGAIENIEQDLKGS